MKNPPLDCKAFFFDAEGTLFRARGSVGEIYARVAESHGVRADPKVLDVRFRETLASRFPPGPAMDSHERNKKEKDGWKVLVATVFYGLGSFRNFDAFFDDVFDAFRGGKGWELYPDTMAALEFLSSRGLRMGIISNFDFRLEGVVAALGILGHFEVLVTPGQSGVCKPDPKIFQFALDALGVQPSHAVHVGDSIASDVAGAQASGITPILVDRGHQHRAAPGVIKISTLEDLRRVTKTGLSYED